MQPAADLVDELHVAGRRAVEDHHGADVHVRRRPFLRKEGRIDRGQPVTVSLGHEADPIVRRMTQNSKRNIGSHGLEAAPLGLGCMGMSEFYGTADEGEAVRTIHRALELGVTLLDTADMYGPFTNEKLVGRAVREWSGERPLIATKFGNVRGENGEFLGIRGDAEYVRNACEASLQRLGLDHIDLYYQHRVDPETPIDETVGAMAELVQEGKVRYLGLSEAGSETIRKAAAIHP